MQVMTVTFGYRQTLPPGESTSLQASLQVFGPPGTFRRDITVVASEAGEDTREQLVLSIYGKRSVSSLLYATPKVFHFGALEEGEKRSKELIVNRYDGTAVRFLRLGDTTPAPTIRLVQDPKPFTRMDQFGNQRHSVSLTLQLSAVGLEVGEYSTTFKIVTESQDESTRELMIPVTAAIVQKQAPWVDRIFVNRLPAGSQIEVALTEPLKENQHVNIPDFVESRYAGDDSIDVKLVDHSAGRVSNRSPAVRISRRKGATTGLIKGILSLTEDNGQETRIPVIVYLP